MSGEVPPGAVYVPPRPNLGPEPWPESASNLPRFGACAVVLALAGLVAWRVRRRRGRQVEPSASPVLPPLIAWSNSVRDALAERFGPGWRAKTTEELAGEPALIAALDADRRAALIAGLSAADRARFAASEGPDPPLPAHLDELLAALRLAAGASSTIKGR